jgi:hypothetical protein
MKIDELRKRLQASDYPSDSYALLQDSSNEALCINHNYDRWTVFYSEKGQRTEEELFLSEDQACEAFLVRLNRMMRRK